MERILFIVAVLSIGAVAASQFMPEPGTVSESSQVAEPSPAEEAETEVASTAEETERRPADNPLDGRRARLEPNGHGQFVTKALLNGEEMEVLVDTGATYVAMNESRAREIGIRLKDGHFRHGVKTANGTIYVALTRIDEIQIGRVQVEDVDVAVMRDEASDMVLLGMSFLKKLKGFSYEGDKLVLTQ